MKHSDFVHQLYLLASGDIDPDDRQLLEEHMQTCEGCRTEFQRLTRLHSVIGLRRSITVDDQLLAAARQQLRLALKAERSGVSFWQKAIDLIETVVSPPARLAFGGAAILVVGIVVGRLAFPPASQPASSIAMAPHDAGETRITNVRILNSGVGGEGVEFTFDAVTPVKMNGNLDDPRIQKVLAHAMLNEENPGVRLRAVSVTHPLKTASADREVKAALILALQNDENAGVRKEALIALQQYPFDGEIKDAFLRTLMFDKNPGLRIAAINGLDSLGVSKTGADANLLSVLKHKSQTDDNNYIRLKAKAVLQEVRQ